MLPDAPARFRRPGKGSASLTRRWSPRSKIEQGESVFVQPTFRYEGSRIMPAGRLGWVGRAGDKMRRNSPASPSSAASNKSSVRPFVDGCGLARGATVFPLHREHEPANGARGRGVEFCCQAGACWAAAGPSGVRRWTRPPSSRQQKATRSSLLVCLCVCPSVCVRIMHGEKERS